MLLQCGKDNIGMPEVQAEVLWYTFIGPEQLQGSLNLMCVSIQIFVRRWGEGRGVHFKAKAKYISME